MEALMLTIRNLTKSYGIAQHSDNTLFKVSQKSGSNNVITVNAGVAFDKDLNIIKALLLGKKEVSYEALYLSPNLQNVAQPKVQDQ